MESAFLLTMSVENIVEQYLNEGLTEEHKVLMNVLMDKLELGEITFHEYQEFSANWRLLELRERLEKEELNSIKLLEYEKTEENDETHDAVMHGEVESVIHGVVEFVMCQDIANGDWKNQLKVKKKCHFEVQFHNGNGKPAKMTWTIEKVPNGRVFDGGGDWLLHRKGRRMKRGLLRVW